MVARALLGRRATRTEQAAILVGAALPDVYMLPFVIWGQIQNIPFGTLWGETYWQEPWQTIGAVSNSIPLFLALLALGLWRSRPLALLAAAALLHLGADFLTHASDAHKHFWPLTEWRFHSPISYWESDYHAPAVAGVEAVLGLGCVALLWQRHKALWVRLILALTGMSYLIIPAFWVLSLGG